MVIYHGKLFSHNQRVSSNEIRGESAMVDILWMGRCEITSWTPTI